MQYARLEPFGEERQDARFAILIANVLNAWRAKGQPRARPGDFLPMFGEQEEKDAETLKAKWESIVSTMKG